MYRCGIEMGIAKLLDVDHSRIRIDFAGLNHMVYGLDVYVDGGSSVKNKVMICYQSREQQLC